MGSRSLPGSCLFWGDPSLGSVSSMVGLMENSKRAYTKGNIPGLLLLVPLSLWWAPANSHLQWSPSTLSGGFGSSFLWVLVFVLSKTGVSAEYFSAFSFCLDCCVWGGLSVCWKFVFPLYFGGSSLLVWSDKWLIKISWLGKRASVFWLVELELFSLECNEVSSSEFWGLWVLCDFWLPIF